MCGASPVQPSQMAPAFFLRPRRAQRQNSWLHLDIPQQLRNRQAHISPGPVPHAPSMRPRFSKRGKLRLARRYLDLLRKFDGTLEFRVYGKTMGT